MMKQKTPASLVDVQRHIQSDASKYKPSKRPNSMAISPLPVQTFLPHVHDSNLCHATSNHKTPQSGSKHREPRDGCARIHAWDLGSARLRLSLSSAMSCGNYMRLVCWGW